MPFILNIWRPVQECFGRSGNIYWTDYDDIRTKGWDFNTVFYSCRCEYYINTSCRMTQIKDTSISFKSEQCHVCYHYLSSLTSSYRDMLAGCSFNCTAYVGHTGDWNQVEVELVSVCTGCMQYVIKGYKCFTMLRRTTYTTYKVRSQSNVSTTEISTHPTYQPTLQTERRKDLI